MSTPRPSRPEPSEPRPVRHITVGDAGLDAPPASLSPPDRPTPPPDIRAATAPAPTVAPIGADQLRRDLAVRDLTDPAAGLHAVQLVLGLVTGALVHAWPVIARPWRSSPVVSVADNYDVLGFSHEAVTRDARYSRYVDATTVLRTHTSALVPGALRALAADPHAPADALVVCPGVVYRRDAIDRIHTGTPHQADLWRVTRSPRPIGIADLHEMIALVVDAALPGARYRTTPAVHPYTVDGVQIDVEAGGEWVEVGECGVADPELLARCGLDPTRVGGLAMGLGLDRLVMLRKQIADIRLMRSDDPRVVAQLGDLERYRPVSSCPAIVRDLSVAVAVGTDDETLGDRVRAALGPAADQVEEVRVLATTAHEDLPPPARARLGIVPGQVNVLVRVVLRRLDRALTRTEANLLRDQVHAVIHEGHAPTMPP